MAFSKVVRYVYGNQCNLALAGGSQLDEVRIGRESPTKWTITQQQPPLTSPAILVARSSGDEQHVVWEYEDAWYPPLSDSDPRVPSSDIPNFVRDLLRRGLPPTSLPFPNDGPHRAWKEPHTTTHPSDPGESASFPLPAQPMLTCFYSTNRDYVMQGFDDLLHADNMRRIQHIPCIAIQGGRDGICTPGTALHQVHGGMELRIPLEAGHSMYDPAITHELLQATDRMAQIPSRIPGNR